MVAVKDKSVVDVSASDTPQKPEDQKCVFVIFNPVSGKQDPEERKKTISDALAEHGYRCQFIATSKEEGAEALAKKAVEAGTDLLAVSGGDGTVMETMSALVGTDIPVAVLPAGTGNLLSVNLGIPMTVPEAVNVALSGTPYKLDLARTQDGRYFAIMGGLGLDAQMIRDADREAKKKLGVFAYFWAAAKNLPRRRARVEVRLDDRPPLVRRAKSVVIANMGKITGGLEAMPTAVPDDGRLDVGIVKAETLAQWLRLIGYALIRRTQDAPDVDVYQARRIAVRTSFPEPVEFDGEDGGRLREWNVEVVPHAVQVLLPPDSPAARDVGKTSAEAAEQSAKRPRRLLFWLLPLLALALGAFWMRRRR